MCGTRRGFSHHPEYPASVPDEKGRDKAAKMSNVTQMEKFIRFRDLHHVVGAFVMPNAWDAGSARMFAHLGFSAIATTSSGYAYAVGRRDSFAGLSRDEILDNAASIVCACDLPVSADLEDGFGASPKTCAQTVDKAVGVGLVGGAIEDATGDENDPIYPFDAAVERIQAAADAADGKPFLLTARAENYLYGRPDLDDTIRRLQAFSMAGADVLYAPGLPDLKTIETVCREVDKPVNMLMGSASFRANIDELSTAGVARISTGGSLAKAGWGAVWRAVQEILVDGTFAYGVDAMPDSELAAMMSQEKLTKRD